MSNTPVIRSMTGFGRGEERCRGFKVCVELGSVNRKQFDCALSLPREWFALEPMLQNLLRQHVARGYVKASVTLSSDGGDSVLLDIMAIERQVAELRIVARNLGLPDDLTATSLLQLPEVQRPRLAVDLLESLWPALEKATLSALEALDTMRQREGTLLREVLLQRIQELRGVSEQISELAPTVPLAYKSVLEQRLAKLLENQGIEEDTAIVAREVAIFADRCDISEELTRLHSHFEQIELTLARGGVCGRTLDFLCQEMFREINTTGAKANHAEISRMTIQFKAGLEAIREQVQNIE